MINSKDISIIVQGAVKTKETSKCLKSLRKWLPQAEIILSTWDGSDLKHLDNLYDKLVLNEDPGCYFGDDILSIPQNLNRQLVTTQNSVKLANRKFIFKIRTDFYLEGNDFLKYWDMFPLQKNEYKIFSHRIIVSSIYSREASYTTKRPILFHPSDFYTFGLNEDIKNYYLNTKLATEEELGSWQFKYPNKLPYLQSTHRYTAEQYICFSYIKQLHPEIQYEDWTDYNKDNIKISNLIMRNNFIFLNVQQSKINSRKHKYTLNRQNYFYGIINFEKFITYYMQDFGTNKKFTLLAKQEHCKYKLSQCCKNLVKPINSMLKFLEKTLKWFMNIFTFMKYLADYIIVTIRSAITSKK